MEVADAGGLIFQGWIHVLIQYHKDAFPFSFALTQVVTLFQ